MPKKPAAKTAKKQSKKSQILAALRRESGATIEQLVKLTGWKSNSVRGLMERRAWQTAAGGGCFYGTVTTQ